jgi:hypothetical protein
MEPASSRLGAAAKCGSRSDGAAGLEFLSGLHVADDTSSVWISIMMAILLSYGTCTGASGDVHTAALACLSN